MKTPTMCANSETWEVMFTTILLFEIYM